MTSDTIKFIVCHNKDLSPFSTNLNLTTILYTALDTYFQLNDLPESTQYYYYIRCSTCEEIFKYNKINSKHYHHTIVLPHKVRDDIQNKKCTVILDYSVEGFWDINWKYITKLIDVNYDDIIWMSSNYLISQQNPGINAQYYNFFERQMAGVHNGSGNALALHEARIKNKTIRTHYNTVYNRRIRTHRVVLMVNLLHYELLNKMIWSWGGDCSDCGDAALFKYKNTPYINTLNEVLSWGEMQSGNPSLEDLSINKATVINYEHIENTYYQLTCETWSNAKTIFLSEKSFKPFLTKQPFVHWGNTGNVAALRLHGYNVFDKWIDHTYDLENDEDKRLAMIVSEIKRLNNIPKEEWSQMLYDMQDIFDFNLNNLQSAEQRFNLNTTTLKGDND